MVIRRARNSLPGRYTAKLWFNMGLAYVRSHKFDDAIGALESSVRIGGDHRCLWIPACRVDHIASWRRSTHADDQHGINGCHATGPYGIEFKAFCHDAMTRVNSYPPPRPRPQPVKELSQFNLADRSRRERTYAFRRENRATTKRRCETCGLGARGASHC